MMRALFALDPAHGAALADELGLKPAAFDEQIFEAGERSHSHYKQRQHQHVRVRLLREPRRS